MWQHFLTKSKSKGDINSYCKPVVFLLILVSLSFFSSCEKEQEQTPEALEMVISQLESNSGSCACEPYINQYVWNRKTVYVLAYSGPACNWIPTYYDEDGHVFTPKEGYTYDRFLQESFMVKQVWSCR